MVLVSFFIFLFIFILVLKSSCQSDANVDFTEIKTGSQLLYEYKSLYSDFRRFKVIPRIMYLKILIFIDSTRFRTVPQLVYDNKRLSVFVLQDSMPFQD